VYLYFVAASAAMASRIVQGEEDLSSLDREEIFIADTAKLAQLFFEVQYKQKAEHGKHPIVDFKNCMILNT